MKIIVIGLGSMGKRRIRLLQRYNKDFSIIGIDKNKERVRETFEKFKIDTYSSLDEAFQKYKFDAAFISTSPVTHGEIINTCLKNDINVFTELNLVSDKYKENIELAKRMKKILFISSTLLYRKETEYINEFVKKTGRNLSYNYHIGQYLKDWHPWEDYRNFFVSNKRTNGCREIFSIELPWIIAAFGEIKSIKVMKNKLSNLDIDYKDNYLVNIEHSSGCIGTLNVDVVSPKALRNFEVYGENSYLTWNGRPDGLKVYNIENNRMEEVGLYSDIDRLKDYSSFVIENAYYDEIKDFFDVINNKTIQRRYTFEEDGEILRWIDKIEKP